jgi:hypothetical protein
LVASLLRNFNGERAYRFLARPGEAWQGGARPGVARLNTQRGSNPPLQLGLAGHGRAGPGLARLLTQQRGNSLLQSGMAGSGEARYGEARTGLARRGEASHTLLQKWSREERLGSAGHGTARRRQGYTHSIPSRGVEVWLNNQPLNKKPNTTNERKYIPSSASSLVEELP